MPVYASDINNAVATYNTILGTSLPTVTRGNKIYYSDIWNMIDEVSNAATLQDYNVNLPSKNNVAKGSIIGPLNWGIPVPVTGTRVQYSSAGTYSWTATEHSFLVTWIVGAGGAGGSGTQYGWGGGGAGGGQGGWQQNVRLSCTPGDVIKCVVGAGGVPIPGPTAQYSDGGPGGVSSIYINGNLVLTVTGGAGGAKNPNTVDLSAKQCVGGWGGSPNGLQGQDGPYAHHDTSSSYGAGGAPGPVEGCLGGAGGNKRGGSQTTGPSVGKDGIFAGSGGGGGGSLDRQGNCWLGGNGADGFIEYIHPAPVITGGGTTNVIGSPITFVQSANANCQSATFASAPTSGNLMVALINGNFGTNPVANSAAGWTLATVDDYEYGNIGVAYKYAGSSEPLNQNPVQTAENMIIWELANAPAWSGAFGGYDASNGYGSSSSNSWSNTAMTLTGSMFLYLSATGGPTITEGTPFTSWNASFTNVYGGKLVGYHFPQANASLIQSANTVSIGQNYATGTVWTNIGVLINPLVTTVTIPTSSTGGTPAKSNSQYNQQAAVQQVATSDSTNGGGYIGVAGSNAVFNGVDSPH